MNDTGKQLSVLVVDDHALVRSGMARLLEDDPQIGEVVEANSGEEALECAGKTYFDLVLMDMSLPGMSGPEASEILLKDKSGTRVIIVSGAVDPGPVGKLLASGISGYVTKGSSSVEMEEAIRTVMRGEQYLSPDIARNMAMHTIHGDDNEDNPFDRLTSRELEIVQLLLGGQRNRQISGALHISEKTVSTHRVRSFEKLEISTTAELVRLAMRHGLWSED